MLISSMTARGLTLTTSVMNVPLSSLNGPNDIAWVQPITSVKNAVAALISGTVMPVWSWPRSPGMESADAGCSDEPIAKAASAVSNNPDVFIIFPFVSSVRVASLIEAARSARRRQLTFDRLRILGEARGEAARHLADIGFLLAGLETIE